MTQPKPRKNLDKVQVEPGAEKRLANILKKSLNTPPSRHGSEPKREKPAKAK